MSNWYDKLMAFADDEERVNSFFDRLNAATDLFFDGAEKMMEDFFESIHQAHYERELKRDEEINNQVMAANNHYFDLLTKRNEDPDSVSQQELDAAAQELKSSMAQMDEMFDSLKKTIGFDEDDDETEEADESGE